MVNSMVDQDTAIQVDTLAQLMIEKGFISENEFYTKLKQVQADYQSRKPEK